MDKDKLTNALVAVICGFGLGIVFMIYSFIINGVI